MPCQARAFNSMGGLAKWPACGLTRLIALILRPRLSGMLDKCRVCIECRLMSRSYIYIGLTSDFFFLNIQIFVCKRFNYRRDGTMLKNVGRI